MAAYFVTGTDTDAGKTPVTAGLLALARRHGFTTLGLKPVARAARRHPRACAMSTLWLCRPRATLPSYALVNPSCLRTGHRPSSGCAADGEPITPTRWLPGSGRLSRHCDLALVEGAGGWRAAQRSGGPGRAGHAPPTTGDPRGGPAAGLHQPCAADGGCDRGLRSAFAGWAGSRRPRLAADAESYADNLATLRHCLPAPAWVSCLA
ncbi:hypothetical protein DSL92_02995 [Billgrantia gudaonensis]|uniref:Dethiobiotin synthase n=1 Tax=Billgrantia gudaonensis TaxID=376427 RepID=A0A3S0VT30_9GAMM|nr:hypothetical protein DSL92_02995 [Halomonas gudaonensis]